MAKIANVALTNTFETWRVRSNEAFDRLSQFAIDNSKLYANTLTANVRFVSAGSTRLGTTGSNRTIVNGLLSGNGNLNVSGNTTLGGASKTLTIGGSGATANATGWFGITGRATVSTNLDVAGNTKFGAVGKTANVVGFLSVSGHQYIFQNLQVAGNTRFGGIGKTLTIGGTGATSNAEGWFGITGRATVSTNLFVGGNTTVVGTTTFRGPVNVGDASNDLLTVTGRATISQNLNVSGNTTIGAAGKTANATGWFGVNGRATVSTNLFVGGNTTINGTTTDRSNALSQTLTDGATINWDTSLGRVATVTLGGNRTVAAPTNLRVGTYILYVIQDATGSRTLTWNSAFKWTAAIAPPLTTTANARDVFSFVSDGTNLYGSFIPDVR